MCKKLICLFSLVFVLLAIAPAANAQVTNLLRNPSFEEDELILDDPDWSTWTTWNPAEGAGSNAEIDDAESVDGTQSVRIDPVGTANWHFMVLQDQIPLDVGQTYTVSFWAKAAEDRPFTAQLKATDNSASWGGTRYDVSTDWAEYTFTADALSDSAKLELWAAGVEVPVWLDFIHLYAGEYVPGIEPRLPVTIPVEPGGDIAAANELAQTGDTILLAEGTYNITSQIAIKSGVTYRGAGAGLTILDGNDLTRAFVAWGDRNFNNTNENANDSGPKGWVLDGLTIQNCVADGNDLFAYAGGAFNLKLDFAENDVDGSGGLSLEEADDDVGAIRLPDAFGEELSLDADIHRFEAMDTNGDGEISEAELDVQILSEEVEFPDQQRDGGAVFVGNAAVGTIQNCEFLNNHTPMDGDDGGALTISGLSVVTVNDCVFEGNYTITPAATTLGGPDGDGGHIKVQGSSASANTPGTTLIANRCDFFDGRAEDDGGAIQSAAVGVVVRLDACFFEGNMAADNGTVLFTGNDRSNELTVTNCVFSFNRSASGSDRMCQVRRNSKFINCTFASNNQDDQDLIYNNANSVDTDGDGVDDEASDVTQVVNCLFANNVVGNGDDVLGSRNASFTIATTNCLFFANTLQSGDDADNTQRPEREAGSLNADPLLDETLFPGAGSPAIDAGVDPADFGVVLLTDFSGNERPQGAGYDIGADEQ